MIDNGQQEELIRSIQLNLRISTKRNPDEGSNAQSQVSRVMISNYQTLNCEDNDGLLDESINNLGIEGFVQPLFKVEKLLEPKKL